LNRHGSLCPECKRDPDRYHAAEVIRAINVQGLILSVPGIEMTVDAAVAALTVGTKNFTRSCHLIHYLNSRAVRHWISTSELESKIASFSAFDKRAWTKSIIEWVALELLVDEGYYDVPKALFRSADPDSLMAIGCDCVLTHVEIAEESDTTQREYRPCRFKIMFSGGDNYCVDIHANTGVYSAVSGSPRVINHNRSISDGKNS